MKKEFTKDEMINKRGCYSLTKISECSFMKLPVIGIVDILNSEIPLKDKGWFLVKKTDLTNDQKKQIALLFAKSVVEIYNKKYPNDNRVNDCISAIELFNEGKITVSELREKRSVAYDAAADAAADAADAADAAAYAAAYAAADAAAYAAADAADADAADAAADAAYAAADAADADAAYADADAAYAAADAYKNKVLQVMIDFVNNN